MNGLARLAALALVTAAACYGVIQTPPGNTSFNGVPPHPLPAQQQPAVASSQVVRLPPVEQACSAGGYAAECTSLQPATYLAPLAVMALGATAPTTPTDLAVTGGNKHDDVWYVNKRVFEITGKATQTEGHQVGLFQHLESVPVGKSAVGADGVWRVKVSVPRDKEYVYYSCALDETTGKPSNTNSEYIRVKIATERPYVRGVDKSGLIFTRGTDRITVLLSTTEVKRDTVEPGKYSLTGPGNPTVTKANFNRAAEAVVLTVTGMTPGTYELAIEGIEDLYGNKMEGEYKTEIYKPVGGDVPSVRPGISGPAGHHVRYREYTEPRDVPDGFNPSDHVETRVARLYYFRDAHRIAQLINRTARSHNRAAVDMQQQLADRARTEAEQATAARQDAERNAIAAAQRTRYAEHELAATEQELTRVFQEIGNQPQETSGEGGAEPTPQPDENSKVLQNVADSLATRARSLRQQVQALRNEEVRLNGLTQQLDGQEQRARKNQFLRESAAGRADPDTFAAGVPNSDDPVEQVSVSVIGEGLIQLRGPIKGINIIRRMINQMDSPVGQVRINVHTVQINGEHGDRMEKVGDKVQRHIDQSRFLTAQSIEILRKAIIKVAAERAMQAFEGEAFGSQDIRDERYLHAFFGRDFIEELRAMDSEFLKTGNKLLSLHSMDTTSLSSALFVMALAKNSTRLQILQEFQQMLACELPAAEQNYLESGIYPAKNRFCREKFVLMAQNARFQSLHGFFNQQYTGHDDTMTPIQREFIRLAQIFKGRLVTEMELKQRIMERAVIEERNGNYRQQLEGARVKEEQAETALKDAAEAISKQRVVIFTSLADFLAAVGSANEEISKYRSGYEPKIQAILTTIKRLAASTDDGESLLDLLKVAEGTYTVTSQGRKSEWQYTKDGAVPYWKPIVPREQERWAQEFAEMVQVAEDLHRELAKYRYTKHAHEWERATSTLNKLKKSMEDDRDPAFKLLNHIHLVQYFKFARGPNAEVLRVYDLLRGLGDALVESLKEPSVDAEQVYQRWVAFRDKLKAMLDDIEDEALKAKAEVFVRDGESGFRQLLPLALDLTLARSKATESRRPLDHKKFLDMLIDEMEEKHIELLEGTRAHTANIDNYIKRLATALESDLNTQFYGPSFRGVREASRSWDVNLAAIETTGILANNRAFAKVSPQATMEFDLPKRAPLMNEAVGGALAMMKDVGALANDPSFLAMASLNAGQPTSSLAAGAGGGYGSVRNVLPGLSTSTGEELLSQNGPGQAKFGSAMEALIPDPAIYKYETGTGYEIRPVIQPDGQAVVFQFKYMYTTNVREPVRADEKHLGRVKRHFIDTDVQLSNYELREVSRYQVALKTSRTSRGVPLLEDIPIAGVLFHPLPQQESSLQENLILAQATIYPTLFDLMGLRWATAVADLDPLRMSNQEFIVRNRRRVLQNRVYDYSTGKVDEFLRIPEADRRADLYRSQESIPAVHPNGYRGPGLDYRDSRMQEGYQPRRTQPQQQFIPGQSKEGSRLLPGRNRPMLPLGTPGREGPALPPGTIIEPYPAQSPPEPPPAPMPAPMSSSMKINFKNDLR
ncbi:MAG: hypothetical protein HQ567_23715 [Candidatus Nealsonbacteria bacterium]|nr:hypothetical protein [Candidatus Nealsonbacteria bacterium]